QSHIAIGRRFRLGASATVHVDPEFPTLLGDDIVVEDRAVIHGCTIGDAVQALKAGILEIADVFVVNMADRPGADRAVVELRTMLQLGPARLWVPPILQTVASEAGGIGELWEALQGHRRHLEESGELAERRGRRVETEVVELVERDLRRRLRGQLHRDGAVAEFVDRARRGELAPHAAAAEIIRTEYDARHVGEDRDLHHGVAGDRQRPIPTT
ncbi:MAG: hypothetical protein H0T39_15135, partial [Actinobacteria bacterium]|nr:hypothetical protein [Actinomycetota bacterium]